MLTAYCAWPWLPLYWFGHCGQLPFCVEVGVKWVQETWTIWLVKFEVWSTVTVGVRPVWPPRLLRLPSASAPPVPPSIHQSQAVFPLNVPEHVSPEPLGVQLVLPVPTSAPRTLCAWATRPA